MKTKKTSKKTSWEYFKDLLCCIYEFYINTKIDEDTLNNEFEMNERRMFIS